MYQADAAWCGSREIARKQEGVRDFHRRYRLKRRNTEIHHREPPQQQDDVSSEVRVAMAAPAAGAAVVVGRAMLVVEEHEPDGDGAGDEGEEDDELVREVARGRLEELGRRDGDGEVRVEPAGEREEQALAADAGLGPHVHRGAEHDRGAGEDVDAERGDDAEAGDVDEEREVRDLLRELVVDRPGGDGPAARGAAVEERLRDDEAVDEVVRKVAERDREDERPVYVGAALDGARHHLLLVGRVAGLGVVGLAALEFDVARRRRRLGRRARRARRLEEVVEEVGREAAARPAEERHRTEAPRRLRLLRPARLNHMR
mmetsp:Transcript_6143/g.25751  ORF Transcript_6143/g.25751 Transcript_6143/m.25751 type:complete len:316 (+) Transcript_6143:402-1349(+)